MEGDPTCCPLHTVSSSTHAWPTVTTDRAARGLGGGYDV